ncbi:MAG TPA: SH3 domain-containing protein [Devosiaceae bacterium]|jgi:uncharacterized protein YraI|nr:SH3 domain-containing protein [Devosiaceae bacterium]
MASARPVFGVLLALAAFGALTSAALAAPTARATGTLTIYSGPGYGYVPIGQLPDGSRVTLAECTPSGRWCRIDQPPGGWVVGSYLVGSPAKVQATPYRPLVNPFFDPFRPHFRPY